MSYVFTLVLGLEAYPVSSPPLRMITEGISLCIVYMYMYMYIYPVEYSRYASVRFASVGIRCPKQGVRVSISS